MVRHHRFAIVLMVMKMEHLELLENEEESLEVLKTFLKRRMASTKKSEVLLEFRHCPSHDFFQKIVQAFFDYKSCYLKMIKYVKIPSVTKLEKDVHEGEEVTLTLPCILLGDVKPGGVIEVSSSLFVLGTVEGKIRLMNPDSTVFAKHFRHAFLYSWDDRKKILDGDNLLIRSSDWEGSTWQE